MSQNERSRRVLVKLIFLIYILLIFEGVLRKWVFPEFSKYIFFIRDPFVLTVYIYAIANGMWPRMRGLFMFAIFFGVIGAIIALAQLLDSRSYTIPLLAAYGWRNYFLYIPLAFIIGNQFTRDDIARILRLTLFLSIPIAILVAIQFFSSPSAWINLQAFSGIAGRIRPAGTFHSVAGQMLFTSSLVAFVISVWLSPKKERMSGGILLILGTCAIFVCLAVSVSRGTVVHSALVMLSAMFSGIIMRGGASKVRAWALPLIIVILGLMLYPILLPEAFDTTMERWSNAHVSESRLTDYGVIGRALLGFVIFLTYIPLVPALGFGLGIGGNASRMVGIELPVIAEDEWSRQIVDMGPVFGIIYILFRITFVIVLGSRAIKATRSSNQALPIILFGFVGIILLNGQVTGNGVINGYCWIFAGLLMASINMNLVMKSKVTNKVNLVNKIDVAKKRGLVK